MENECFARVNSSNEPAAMTGSPGQLFIEIAQRSQRMGSRLNFVEKKQAAAFENIPPQQPFEFQHDPFNIQTFENIIQKQMFLQIDFVEHQSVMFGELPDECRLSDLSRSPQHQRFPALFIEPIL